MASVSFTDSQNRTVATEPAPLTPRGGERGRGGGECLFPDQLSLPEIRMRMRCDNSRVAPEAFRVTLLAGPSAGRLAPIASGRLWLTELSVYNRIQKANVVWDFGEDAAVTVQTVVHYLRRAERLYDLWVRPVLTPF